MRNNELSAFLEHVRHRDPDQPEFLQAVEEVMSSIWPFIDANPRYAENGLLERIVEPERIIQFRIAWCDDSGCTQVNRGWRVQHSSAIGPFKGGMRFHPQVTLSVLKFLAFEQTFKNALTTIPIGGAKGGADFDPKGKSPAEIMRFCQTLAIELHRHLGPQTDIPAGDIGVGAREVGYMAGMIKKLRNDASAFFTGKHPSHGGSLMRPEATGYGLVYFVEEMLEQHNRSLEGQRVLISGAGNVALHAAEKVMQLGGRVVTLSDSGGTLVVDDDTGITPTMLLDIHELKTQRYGRLADFAERHGLSFEALRRPWHVPGDVALPCATQNELQEDDAVTLVDNGVWLVAEGANMPTDSAAARRLHAAKVLYAPGKATNAGGVATSGLEMAQNATLLKWPRAEVDERLRVIMRGIHETCVAYGRDDSGRIDYQRGANVAGFALVADAMLAQGVT
nr:NADP-specific glutamate dehydrogenase [Algiphilus aromaticivorans]